MATADAASDTPAGARAGLLASAVAVAAVAPLRTVRAVASDAMVRRAAIVAGLAFVERLLAPAAAYAWMALGPAWAVGLAVGASGMLGVRGFVQRGFTARNESELHQAAVKAILGGDVLRPTLLPDAEARISLFQGVYRVGTLLAESLPDLVASMAAVAVLAVGIGWLEPPQVTIVALMAVGLAGAFVFGTRRVVDRAQTASWAAWDVVAEAVDDACDARLELVAMGRAGEFLEGFTRKTRQWEDKARAVGRTSALLGRIPLLLMAAAVGAAIVAEARLRGASWVDAGLHATLLATCAPAFFGVARGLQDLSANAPRLRLIERVLEGGKVAARTGTTPPASPGAVEWKDVRFAYEPAGAEVLKGVSFTWKKGELFVLAGPNGSGKSTCLRAALGLGIVTGGSVLVDGAPLGGMDVVAWRRSIAFLPQRPHLPLRATVRECLRFVDPEVTDEAMREALAKVQLWEGLARIHATNPLEATVGPLSAGQRQRLALARVLCRPAPLVMLDEPDANLDREGVALVGEIVAELARERMVLVVAHSKELAERAGRVVRIEGGTSEPGVNQEA